MLRLPYTSEEYKDKPVSTWRLRSIRQRPTTKRTFVIASVLSIIYLFVRLYNQKGSEVWNEESTEDDLFVEGAWHSTALARSLMTLRSLRFPGRPENVFFLLNGLTNADSNLVTLGCDMSLLQPASKVHFIILGAGRLSIEAYQRVNAITDESCAAHFHDARVPAGDDVKRTNKLVSYATNAISLIVDTYSPQAILYTHSLEQPKPNWFTSATHTHRHRATFIELAQSAVASLGWIATLPARSLNEWNHPRIDVLVDAGADAGSLKRLFTSLSEAHYPNTHKPLIMLDYNASLVSDSTYDFADSLSRAWPTDKLVLKSRTTGPQMSPFEAWYPVSPDAHLLLLSGTDEVSPWYYHYLLKSILTHRYPQSQSRLSVVYGVTLQSVIKGKSPKLGDLGTPTLLFPNHFADFHETLRHAAVSARTAADQANAWNAYVRDHQLVVVAPPAIVHEDGTFVFVKDNKEDKTIIDVNASIENTGPQLLEDAEWWRSIGPDRFVEGISLKNGG